MHLQHVFFLNTCKFKLLFRLKQRKWTGILVPALIKIKANRTKTSEIFQPITDYPRAKSKIQVNLIRHCNNKTKMRKAQLRCFRLPSARSSGDPFRKLTKSALDKTLAIKCQVEGIGLRWSDAKATMKTCNRFPMCQKKLLKKTLIYCSEWSLQTKNKL